MLLHFDDNIFKGGNSMRITEGIGSISYSQLIGGIQRPNNEGAASSPIFDAVTSATSKSNSTWQKISFNQLSEGEDSISITDLKAALEKLKVSEEKQYNSTSETDTTTEENTKSSTPIRTAYRADAMTGATTSSASYQSGSDNRINLVLDILNKNNNGKQSYSAKEMDNLLTILNGLNSNA